MISPVGMSGSSEPAALVAIIASAPSALSTSSGRRMMSPRPVS